VSLASVLVASTLRDQLRGAPAGSTRQESASPLIATTAERPAMPPTEQTLLRIEDLSVAYGDGQDATVVVREVSLDVAAGEVVGVVGESGSGKTQTILAVLGLLPEGGRVRSGQVWLSGQRLGAEDERAMQRIRGSRIGYVSQEPTTNLDPSFRIGSQLTAPMRQHLGLGRRQARDRALDLLARVGIDDPQRVFRCYPHQISGGMAQRVLIACAVSCDPDLLIADEPTTALDVTVQAEVLDLLRSLQRERNMALLLVTHDLGVVADSCTRVAVMRGGQLVEVNDVTSLFAQPDHPYTRQLLRSIPEALPPLRARLLAGDDADPVLEVDRLEVGFGAADPVLTGLSLHVQPGETVGLVGESGSGKTTLGRTILGLVPPRSGSIRFAGRELVGLAAAERRRAQRGIQVVFQDPYSSLNPVRPIADTLAEPLYVTGVDPREARRRVREVLEAVNLPANMDRRLPREFSGGQRQRIAIARALALEPRLIVCDEAVSALDLSTQAQVLQLLARIQEQTGVSYLFISHDLAVVRHISHRTAVIRKGRIVEMGDADRVATSPQHWYTRELIAAAPVPDPAAQAIRRQERQSILRGRNSEHLDPPDPLQYRPGGRTQCH
jgi:peptide/nickel transport system ATP-binding protein